MTDKLTAEEFLELAEKAELLEKLFAANKALMEKITRERQTKPP